MQNTTTRKTFGEIMQEYKQLDQGIAQLIRNVAVMTLKQSGFEEIGSSDVNCEIVGLYNCYCDNGDWNEIVRYGLDLVRSR